MRDKSLCCPLGASVLLPISLDQATQLLATVLPCVSVAILTCHPFYYSRVPLIYPGFVLELFLVTPRQSASPSLHTPVNPIALTPLHPPPPQRPDKCGWGVTNLTMTCARYFCGVINSWGYICATTFLKSPHVTPTTSTRIPARAGWQADRIASRQLKWQAASLNGER